MECLVLCLETVAMRYVRKGNGGMHVRAEVDVRRR